MTKITTRDHRTLEMRIFPHLGEKCAKMWNSQKWHYLDVRGYENLHFFRLSGKPLKMMKNTTTWPLDSGHLKCEYLPIWVRCENSTFSTGSWKSSFFSTFWKAFLKGWKTPPHDHRTLEMRIFTHLGEKYAKNVKWAKMTLFRQVRGYENLPIFSTFWKAF